MEMHSMLRGAKHLALVHQAEHDGASLSCHRARTRKLSHRASCEVRVSLSHLFRERGITVSTFEWSENVTGSTQAGLPGHSQNERQGNCFLSYLFRESGTIVLMFKRSENVIRISGPLYSDARCFLIGGLKKILCTKYAQNL